MKSSLDDIPDPSDRYTVGDLIGKGVFGRVHDGCDNQASKKKVAIKMQKYDKDTREFVEEEYEVLKELGTVIYLVGFYGVYKKDNEIWFVMENCESDTVSDLVLALLSKNRRISEEHIGYILKELVKAIIYLHENNVIHRDIKASNILLTKEGEVKLCDFGLAKKLKDREEKLAECVGSPCWMAPEVVTANPKEKNGFYDNRVDVWALGITAIEIAEGRPPFQNMHPSRAMSQIEKNPPPTLEKVSNWSENFHDFISECLVKFYEHRPYIMEVIDHPFLQEIPENNYHLTLEVKSLIKDAGKAIIAKRTLEVAVLGKYLKRSIDGKLEKMLEEDLADISDLNEKKVLQLFEERFKNADVYSFVGDILVAVNPNENLNIYGDKFHYKYNCKSRSENAPHIYALADTAYQNALHHKIPQQIVVTGESASGKTTNYLHLIDHIFHIGENHPINHFRMMNGIKLIHALTHASTPTNDYSTRCVLKTEIALGPTGKLTGASFKAICLDKWRISGVDMNQSNFHLIYYIYDGLVQTDAIEKYKLHNRRNYRYLRIPEDDSSASRNKPRDNPDQNYVKYKKIFSYLEEYEFSEEQITTFFSVIAAVLNLGEIRFQGNEADGTATLEDREYAEKFADLMEIDRKKFCWALTNYCVVKRGNVFRKKNSCDEARDARDVLANNLYCRLVDFVIGLINDKLAIGTAIYGQKYTIKLLDFYGFECFKTNHLPQFFVNCLNEQLQYHYLQRIFSWEIQDLQTDEIDFEPFHYFDNRKTLNQLLSKPEGILCIIDDAAKRNLDGKYILDNIQKQETNRVMITKTNEFSVAHYTGLVPYNAKEMADKNRDYLPPELIETMRESENPIVKILFTNKLDRTGNLVLNAERAKRLKHERRLSSGEQYSQIKNMRTSATTFRSLCLDLLKELSVGGGSGGTHFVRCIRSDLKGKPQNFHKELVRQQIRALAVIETANFRQKGYPQRISFPEFLRRYKFLAFDFDENVDITKENCRLLLVRLKMEGWAIGKSKVFLKYYNEEYLSRLYETQVKKIIKIQSILRGFLVKCRMSKKVKEQEQIYVDEMKNRRKSSSVMTPEEAAEIIQKAYRKSAGRGGKGPSDKFTMLKEKDFDLVMPYARKWKSQSIFHVLMQYRAVKLHDFFNFSQQVHLYNQNAFYQIQQIQYSVDLESINKNAQVFTWMGPTKPAVQKLHFKLNEIPYYDTSEFCDPLTNLRSSLEGDEFWDSPYRWRESQHSSQHMSKSDQNLTKHDQITAIPYNRNPEEPLATLPGCPSDAKYSKEKENVATKANFVFENGKANEHIGNSNVKQKQELFSSIELKKTDNSLKYEQTESYSFNSTPANRDFEFIKTGNSLTSRPKDVDPIAELRTIAQRRGSTSEDDPPFNFQGMLRKTNFQRESMKKGPNFRKSSIEAVRRFSLSKDRDKEKDRALTYGDEKAMIIASRPVFMELVPGLVLEGVEVDL